MENVHNETTKYKKKMRRNFEENVQTLEFYAIKYIYE